MMLSQKNKKEEKIMLVKEKLSQLVQNAKEISIAESNPISESENNIFTEITEKLDKINATSDLKSEKSTHREINEIFSLALISLERRFNDEAKLILLQNIIQERSQFSQKYCITWRTEDDIQFNIAILRALARYKPQTLDAKNKATNDDKTLGQIIQISNEFQPFNVAPFFKNLMQIAGNMTSNNTDIFFDVFINYIVELSKLACDTIKKDSGAKKKETSQSLVCGTAIKAILNHTPFAQSSHAENKIMNGIFQILELSYAYHSLYHDALQCLGALPGYRKHKTNVEDVINLVNLAEKNGKNNSYLYTLGIKTLHTLWITHVQWQSNSKNPEENNLEFTEITKAITALIKRAKKVTCYELTNDCPVKSDCDAFLYNHAINTFNNLNYYDPYVIKLCQEILEKIQKNELPSYKNRMSNKLCFFNNIFSCLAQHEFSPLSNLKKEEKEKIIQICRNLRGQYYIIARNEGIIPAFNTNHYSLNVLNFARNTLFLHLKQFILETEFETLDHQANISILFSKEEKSAEKNLTEFFNDHGLFNKLKFYKQDNGDDICTIPINALSNYQPILIEECYKNKESVCFSKNNQAIAPLGHHDMCYDPQLWQHGFFGHSAAPQTPHATILATRDMDLINYYPTF